MPKVTVLLPVYNAEKHLNEAIDSVLAQTFTDFELLIIDDGSTDSSWSIIHKYQDRRIRCVRNEKNIRLIRTLNRGIEEASGEFIARMDSDDICFPQRLERQLQFFSKEPALDVCGSFAIRIDVKGYHKVAITKPTGKLLTNTVWLPTPLLHPTVMLRTVVARRFPYDVRTLHCEDYDLWLRMFKEGVKIENYPAPLLYYRVHEGGISLQNRDLQLKNSYTVFQRHFPDVHMSFEEYCGLIGVAPTVSFGRRFELLRLLVSTDRLGLLDVIEQVKLHAKLGILGKKISI